VFVERAELLGSVALALLGSHEAEIARARSNSAPLASGLKGSTQHLR